jgi:hypothetical protein
MILAHPKWNLSFLIYLSIGEKLRPKYSWSEEWGKLSQGREREILTTKHSGKGRSSIRFPPQGQRENKWRHKFGSIFNFGCSHTRSEISLSSFILLGIKLRLEYSAMKCFGSAKLRNQISPKQTRWPLPQNQANMAEGWELSPFMIFQVGVYETVPHELG